MVRRARGAGDRLPSILIEDNKQVQSRNNFCAGFSRFCHRTSMSGEYSQVNLTRWQVVTIFARYVYASSAPEPTRPRCPFRLQSSAVGPKRDPSQIDERRSYRLANQRRSQIRDRRFRKVALQSIAKITSVCVVPIFLDSVSWSLIS